MYTALLRAVSYRLCTDIFTDQQSNGASLIVVIPNDGGEGSSFRVVRFSLASPAVSHDVDILAEQKRIPPENQVQLGSGKPASVELGAFPLHQQRLFLPQFGEELSRAEDEIPSDGVDRDSGGESGRQARAGSLC